MKKTYGVDGLMEWQARIPCGKATVLISFTGGTLTTYGTTPAEYTTSDLLKQTIIERSDYYKQGRIKLLRQTPDERDGTTVPTGKGTDALETVGAMDERERVKVASLEDARDYLSEKHGVKKSGLTSRRAIYEAARRNGVEFVGIELS